MDPKQVFLPLKMHAWSDWGDWHHVYQLIFGHHTDPNSIGDKVNLMKIHKDMLQANFKKALCIINQWLSKNVGNADHIKAIKM